jgi:hypothetical protein
MQRVWDVNFAALKWLLYKHPMVIAIIFQIGFNLTNSNQIYLLSHPLITTSWSRHHCSNTLSHVCIIA